MVFPQRPSRFFGQRGRNAGGDEFATVRVHGALRIDRQQGFHTLAGAVVDLALGAHGDECADAHGQRPGNADDETADRDQNGVVRIDGRQARYRAENFHQAVVHAKHNIPQIADAERLRRLLKIGFML